MPRDMTDAHPPNAEPGRETGRSPSGPHERAAAAVLVGALVAALVGLGLLIRIVGPLPLDLSLPPAIMAWYPRVLTDLFDTIGTLPVFAAVMLAGAVASMVGRRPGLAAAFVIGLGGEIPSALVKLAVDRARPPASTEIEAFLTAASYPSGHTVRAVLMAGLIVAAVGWHHRSTVVRTVAVVAGLAFVSAVGLARIASGEHWPTDVLGGLLLGAAWLTVCLTVEDWISGWSRAGQRGGP